MFDWIDQNIVAIFLSHTYPELLAYPTSPSVSLQFGKDPSVIRTAMAIGVCDLYCCVCFLEHTAIVVLLEDIHVAFQLYL